MKHLTASTSPSPFSGENWFDPLEDAIRFRVRAFIEAVVAEEAQAALGGRARYQRSGAPNLDSSTTANGIEHYVSKTVLDAISSSGAVQIGGVARLVENWRTGVSS